MIIACVHYRYAYVLNIYACVLNIFNIYNSRVLIQIIHSLILLKRIIKAIYARSRKLIRINDDLIMGWQDLCVDIAFACEYARRMLLMRKHTYTNDSLVIRHNYSYILRSNDFCHYLYYFFAYDCL